jgi:hypothetical protein
LIDRSALRNKINEIKDACLNTINEWKNSLTEIQRYLIQNEKGNLTEIDVCNIQAILSSYNDKEELGDKTKMIKDWIRRMDAFQNQSEQVIYLSTVVNFINDMKNVTKGIMSHYQSALKDAVAGNYINSYPRWAEFYKKTGVLIQIKACSAFAQKLGSQGNSPPTTPALTPLPRGKSDDQKVNQNSLFYRQSIPMKINFLSIDDTFSLQTIFSDVQDILHPEMPTYPFAFSPNVFSSKNLSIKFDERGRPVLLGQTSTSSAKNIAASLEESLKAARDEYAESLKKITEIQESQRKIKLDDLLSKIEKINKEKELLDAQLNLEGETASYSLRLKQKQLEAEKAAVDTELQLEILQATKEQSIETAKLKTELEMLNKEIELLKAKLALEEAKKK